MRTIVVMLIALFIGGCDASTSVASSEVASNESVQQRAFRIIQYDHLGQDPDVVGNDLWVIGFEVSVAKNDTPRVVFLAYEDSLETEIPCTMETEMSGELRRDFWTFGFPRYSTLVPKYLIARWKTAEVSITLWQ